MKWRALVTLTRLRQNRDIACHVTRYRDDGGMDLLALDLRFPVRTGTVPFALTILPDGAVSCVGGARESMRVMSEAISNSSRVIARACTPAVPCL